MTLNLGLYLNTNLIDKPSFFVVLGPERGMYATSITKAIRDATTHFAPPPCKQLSPINLIKWSN